MPPRSRLDTPQGTTLVMPAFVEETGDCCVKVVSVHDANRSRGLPPVTGVAVVLDSATGMPSALLDAHALTSLRSGAAGGLAADLLARKNARVLVVIGSGEQARAQLRGVLAVRPIEKVFLCGRSQDAVRQLAAEVTTWPNAPTLEIAN